MIRLHCSALGFCLISPSRLLSQISFQTQLSHCPESDVVVLPQRLRDSELFQELSLLLASLLLSWPMQWDQASISDQALMYAQCRHG